MDVRNVFSKSNLKRLARSRRKVLFLDYDGTLVPIVKDPDQTRMDPSVTFELKRLSRRPDMNLVVISGRSLKDLRRRIPLKRNVVLSGNHGFELAGCGMKPPPEARRARRYRRMLGIVVHKLRDWLQFLPGAEVEDKGFTISVHYRNVAREYRPFFNELLHFFKRQHRAYSLVWRPGKKVWQIYPDMHWDKGKMVHHILKEFPGAMPLAVGDDETDEDMFNVLGRRGITVHVGSLRRSKAQYRLRSQRSIARFLGHLASA